MLSDMRKKRSRGRGGNNHVPIAHHLRAMSGRTLKKKEQEEDAGRFGKSFLKRRSDRMHSPMN